MCFEVRISDKVMRYDMTLKLLGYLIHREARGIIPKLEPMDWKIKEVTDTTVKRKVRFTEENTVHEIPNRDQIKEWEEEEEKSKE